jgi:hypothetical protein
MRMGLMQADDMHDSIQTQYPISRRPCPKCSEEMMITRIEPDIPGYDLRTFECTTCGQEAFSLGTCV